MYEELVALLRLKYDMDPMVMAAADALEELSMRLHGDEAAIAGMKREIEYMVRAGKPRWIPVTDVLPEEDCHVLAYYGFNHDGYLGMMFMQVLDYYARDPRPHFQHEGINGMTVTHWMPLPQTPELPKEEI